MIELIMVIVILGILSVTVLPRLLDLSARADTEAARANVMIVREAVAVRYASNAAYGLEAANHGLPTTIEANMFHDSVIPMETYTKSNAVQVGSAIPSGVAGGWYYNSAQGRVYVNHTAYSGF